MKTSQRILFFLIGASALASTLTSFASEADKRARELREARSKQMKIQSTTPSGIPQLQQEQINTIEPRIKKITDAGGDKKAAIKAVKAAVDELKKMDSRFAYLIDKDKKTSFADAIMMPYYSGWMETAFKDWNTKLTNDLTPQITTSNAKKTGAEIAAVKKTATDDFETAINNKDLNDEVVFILSTYPNALISEKLQKNIETLATFIKNANKHAQAVFAEQLEKLTTDVEKQIKARPVTTDLFDTDFIEIFEKLVGFGQEPELIKDYDKQFLGVLKETVTKTNIELMPLGKGKFFGLIGAATAAERQKEFLNKIKDLIKPIETIAPQSYEYVTDLKDPVAP